MSRDFEQAYIELAQTEIPDLWDRIEAGLSEKSTPIDSDKIKETKQSITAKNKKSKVTVFIRKYSAVAAALLCVAILIPAFSLIKQLGIGENKSDMGQYAAAPAEETEACADTANGVEEMTLEEEMTLTESTAASEEEMMSAESAAASEEEMTLTESTADPEEELADKERAEEWLESATEESRQGATVLCNVRIKVLEVTGAQDYFAGTAMKESGQIYVAEVQEDPEELLSQGEQIAIFVPVTLSIALCEDGVYELDLVSVTIEEESFFEIERYHKRLEP